MKLLVLSKHNHIKLKQRSIISKLIPHFVSVQFRWVIWN